MTTDEPMVRSDGTYPVVALRQEAIHVGVVQTRAQGVDGAESGAGTACQPRLLSRKHRHRAGLRRFRCDLLLFHEFPITGFTNSTRGTSITRCRIRVPGPEVAEVAKKRGDTIAISSSVRTPKTR
jgi:hypothetical protein